MFDMMKMMGKVKEMQAKMKEAQAQLKDIQVEAESGGGLVRVTSNGNKEVLNLEIDESLITPQDKDMLRDLIIAATNKAVSQAEIAAKDHIKKSTEGMIPDIPGLDLSGLF